MIKSTYCSYRSSEFGSKCPCWAVMFPSLVLWVTRHSPCLPSVSKAPFCLVLTELSFLPQPLKIPVMPSAAKGRHGDNDDASAALALSRGHRAQRETPSSMKLCSEPPQRASHSIALWAVRASGMSKSRSCSQAPS